MVMSHERGASPRVAGESARVGPVCAVEGYAAGFGRQSMMHGILVKPQGLRNEHVLRLRGSEVAEALQGALLGALGCELNYFDSQAPRHAPRVFAEAPRKVQGIGRH